MNKNLGEKILCLREQGKNYNEIVVEVGCSKSTVAYHCGKGQKEKWLIRQRKTRKRTKVTLHDKILKLRAEGYSYKKIAPLLGCSYSTVAYHSKDSNKVACNLRVKRSRADNPLLQKIDRFSNRSLKDRAEDFQRREKNKLGKRKLNFRWKDVISIHGWKTKCYLSGRDIDLHDGKMYQFDHVIPASKGGDNSIQNLGITCRQANLAKSDMTIDEFLLLCSDVLKYHGYAVEKVKK